MDEIIDRNIKIGTELHDITDLRISCLPFLYPTEYAFIDVDFFGKL